MIIFKMIQYKKQPATKIVVVIVPKKPSSVFYCKTDVLNSRNLFKIWLKKSRISSFLTLLTFGKFLIETPITIFSFEIKVIIALKGDLLVVERYLYLKNLLQIAAKKLAAVNKAILVSTPHHSNSTISKTLIQLSNMY